MTRGFNERVRTYTFQLGDLTLKNVHSMTCQTRGKFAPNYEDPYVVNKVLPGGPLILNKEDGLQSSKLVYMDIVTKS